MLNLNTYMTPSFGGVLECCLNQTLKNIMPVEFVKPNHNMAVKIIEPRHEISNNVVCATRKGTDQPVHTNSLIRTFASHLNIL